MTQSSRNLTAKLALFTLLIICLCPKISSRDPLPDNYLPFLLKKTNNRFEGTCKYMKGFLVSIILPEEFKNKEVTKDIFFSLVKNKQISGVLDAPNGKSSPIDFEIVQFRKKDDIYMKTSQGYFLWEQFDFKRKKLSFVIYWWYCPPAQTKDLEILDMAEKLLSDSTRWNRNDDRICEPDIESNCWSLFCALKQSSVIIMNEYNHHNTAMQTVRNIITELNPDIEFEHTLMDFNNSTKTNHKDILDIIKKAKGRIKSDLDKNKVE